jgi:hypothetical protein
MKFLFKIEFKYDETKSTFEKEFHEDVSDLSDGQEECLLSSGC